ncbi:MAG: CPBP family intramembrane metalloprotease [Leptolyngbyaceae cyanobacterium CRU_2_3]|nr:CPBP family intramembrane metalloprotease [Leptolyngbyaceae cyanobacterium CRU_2_3]
MICNDTLRNHTLKSKLANIACYPAPIRILALLLVLLVCWLPIATPIALFTKDPNTVTLITMPLLFVGFLLLIPRWGKWLYRNKRIFHTYGLTITRQAGMELLQGLAIGLLSLLLLFGMQGGLGWLIWQTPSPALFKVALEGLLVGLGTGFAEELVFRGWMFDELQRDYSDTAALWANSGLYAVLHFIKPLPEVIRTFPQFPGLLLLGLALVWARRSTRRQMRITGVLHQGRLGLPIGLHAGLIWGYYLVNVGQLARYSGQVPEWLTGVDKNPLAGGIGLVFLVLLAAYMGWRSHFGSPKHSS